MAGRMCSRMMRPASTVVCGKPMPTQYMRSMSGPSSQPMFQQCMPMSTVLRGSSSSVSVTYCGSSIGMVR